jgi:hypothetical protein
MNSTEKECFYYLYSFFFQDQTKVTHAFDINHQFFFFFWNLCYTKQITSCLKTGSCAIRIVLFLHFIKIILYILLAFFLSIKKKRRGYDIYIFFKSERYYSLLFTDLGLRLRGCCSIISSGCKNIHLFLKVQSRPILHEIFF